MVIRDQSYATAKRIKRGQATISAGLSPLADWIIETYDVSVINILYGVGEFDHLPWLEIWFEFTNDLTQFKDDKNPLSFNKEKQEAISDQLRRLCNERKGSGIWNWLKTLRSPGYKTVGLKFYGQAFEPMAQREAHQRIPKSHIQQLQEAIGPDRLWKIDNSMGEAIFFAYTNEQVNLLQQDGTRQQWNVKYFNLVKEYDEFDYISLSDFHILLDSKESFDNNYQEIGIITINSCSNIGHNYIQYLNHFTSKIIEHKITVLKINH